MLCACGAAQSTSTDSTASTDTAQTQTEESTEMPTEGAEVTEATATTADEAHPRRIIIDTDTGADDASAIILAALDPDVKIEGITVLLGNVDLAQAARNALMAMQIAGRKAPVYEGSDTSYDGTAKDAHSVFGADGMGDQNLIHPTGKVMEGDAIDFILDTVRTYPDEIEIVSIGPATNIAKAIARDPQTMSHVSMIWSMGTAGLGPGNATPVAEFNVYADAPAYKIMLESGIPITIVGLDVCLGDAEWTKEQLEELKESGKIGEFVGRSFMGLQEYFAKNGSPDAIDDCDAVAMMCALHSDFVTSTKRCYASCITEEGETYAEVIFYQEGFTYDRAGNEHESNVTLVTGVDGKNFFERYKAAVSTNNK